MYNTAFRIINQKEEAEEAMHEGFLSAFEKIDTYRGEVNFGAWLKRIVINKSIDHVRKRKTNFTGMEKIPEIGKSEINFENENLVHHIQGLIQKLPENYRTIVNLNLIEEYDHNEIGELLKITPENSRIMLYRGKKKLNEWISNLKLEYYES